MNNFHIRIEDCTEAQKARLKQVYGKRPVSAQYLSYSSGAISLTCSPYGQKITPDEMLKRLGLDAANSDQVYALKYDLYDAEQKIKDLEQQLAKQPLPVDWSLVEPEYDVMCQDSNGDVDFFSSEKHMGDLRVIVTRPKPKYTDEQIEVALILYSNYVKHLSGDGQNSESFTSWVRRQGQ